MADWPGLLKWTLENTGTEPSKDIKPMSEEDKKFLTEAFEDYCLNDVRAMENILRELETTKEEPTETNKNERLDKFDQLYELIESLDMAKNFYKVGGINFLLQTIQNSIHNEIKQLCSEIFSFCVQNNGEVQYFAIKHGAFQLVNWFLKEKSPELQEAYLGAISSLIRGDQLYAKRQFIDIDGIKLLLQILKNKDATSRAKKKVFFFLKDLIFYDQILDQELTDISNFQNTNFNKEVLQKQQIALSDLEKNKTQKEKDNIKKEYQKYKHFIKQNLIQDNFINDNLNILNDLDIRNLESRISYLFIVKHLIEYKSNTIIDQNFKETIKKYIKDIQNRIKIDNVYNEEFLAAQELSKTF